MATIRIKNTQQLKRVFTMFEGVVVKSSARAMKAMANLYKDRLIERIKAQRFQSFKRYPLSERYRKWKARQGLDTRVMIRTGGYIDSIVVERIKRGRYRHTSYQVGIPDHVKARDAEGNPTDLPMHALARIHEHGTSTVPARPHWKPTTVEINKEARKMRKRFNKELVKELRKALG